MTDKKTPDQSNQADPSAKVAKYTSEGTLAGQPGTIRELSADEKPDPTTIAHEQILDDVQK